MWLGDNLTWTDCWRGKQTFRQPEAAEDAVRCCATRLAGVVASVDGPRPVIAVALDQAFQFIYEDNIDLLRAAGAEVVSFSPLRDKSLPARTAGILLCGGFPEVYAGRLAANRSLHAALWTAHRRGLPIYAECGGLMYLTESIRTEAAKHTRWSACCPAAA